MKVADYITLAVLLGVVVAFFLARRNGKQNRAAALAKAYADGHAAAMAVSSSRSSVLNVNGVGGLDVESLAGVVARILSDHSADDDDHYLNDGAGHDSRGLPYGRTMRDTPGLGVGDGVDTVQDSARRFTESARVHRPVVVNRHSVRGVRDIRTRSDTDVDL